MTDNKDEKIVPDRPINILLVEDSEADVKITLRAFRNARIKNNVYVASDGQEALDFIRHQGKYKDRGKFPRPDLILLDIKLPKLDGFQVLDNIKNDLRYNFIPVIMLTSSKDEQDIAKSYRKGASSFIQKPVSYDEFVKIVDGLNLYWQFISKLPETGTSEG
jgi:two-component system response regulator